MYAPLDFTYDIIHHGHVHLIGTSVHYIVLCDSAIYVHTLHSSFFLNQHCFHAMTPCKLLQVYPSYVQDPHALICQVVQS